MHMVHTVTWHSQTLTHMPCIRTHSRLDLHDTHAHHRSYIIMAFTDLHINIILYYNIMVHIAEWHSQTLTLSYNVDNNFNTKPHIYSHMHAYGLHESSHNIVTYYYGACT